MVAHRAKVRATARVGPERRNCVSSLWKRVSHVHHHDQADDLRRAVEISERVAHGPSLPRAEVPRAFGLTRPAGCRVFVRREAPRFALITIQKTAGGFSRWLNF